MSWEICQVLTKVFKKSGDVFVFEGDVIQRDSDCKVNTTAPPHAKTFISFLDEVKFDPRTKGKIRRCETLRNLFYSNRILLVRSLIFLSRISSV